MSIRRRLVIIVLALVGLSLAAVGLTTYVRLDKFLINQTDASLDHASVNAARRLAAEVSGRGPSRLRPPTRSDEAGTRATTPNAFFIEVRDNAGGVLVSTPREVGEAASSPPKLPADLATGTQTRYTVDSVDGSIRYRLLVQRIPGQGVAIVGASLQDADSTLRHALIIEVIGGVAVLLALAMLSRFFVGVGLRPLRSMEKATMTIAGGDFSHRIEVTNPKTEVGGLGTSFNTMVERIQTSFAAQQLTEDRLRRFVSDASHELRTPLTSIRGYSELYRTGALAAPDEVGKAMGRIEQEATRIGLLVDDLLALARLDEGRALKPCPVDLVALVSDALDDASAVEPHRSFALDVPDEPVIVSGDRTRLDQVIANLLSNVRAHAGCEAAVTVSVTRDDDHATITVRDTGVGMTPEVLEHVFERFFRADVARSRAADHFGLGLAIAASIIQAHNGTIEAESSVGIGTNLTVSLPAI